MKKVLWSIAAALLLSVSLSARETDYASSHYKYISVYEKEALSQHMQSAMSLDTFQSLIRKEWGMGYDITELKYGNGKWIGIFTKVQKDSHQTYVVAPRWDGVNNVLESYWKKGYYMTQIEHGLAEWIVVFEKNTGYTNQSYERRKTLDAFSDAVEKRWKEGYDLIDLEYGQGRWTGIFAENTGYIGQSMVIRSRWSEMVRVIDAHWEKGYRILNIEQTLGKWMCLFVKSKDAKAQKYETSPTVEKIKEKLTEAQKEGYHLTDLAEGW